MSRNYLADRRCELWQLSKQSLIELLLGCACKPCSESEKNESRERQKLFVLLWVEHEGGNQVFGGVFGVYGSMEKAERARDKIQSTPCMAQFIIKEVEKDD